MGHSFFTRAVLLLQEKPDPILAVISCKAGSAAKLEKFHTLIHEKPILATYLLRESASGIYKIQSNITLK